MEQLGAASPLGGLLLRSLLVAELWQLWPWQMKLLEAAAVAEAADATAEAEAGQVVEGQQEAVPAARAAGGVQEVHAATASIAIGSGSSLPFPFVPRVLLGSSSPASLPPVTRQQLQLVLQVLVQADAVRFGAASLLLVLLLQRADPGLRAAFLNGPEASLLLVTLVNWGCHPKGWGRGGAPGPFGSFGTKDTWEDCVSVMVARLKGDDDPYVAYTHSHSATMVLAQCYLEPCHLDSQQPCGPEAVPYVLTDGCATGEPQESHAPARMSAASEAQTALSINDL
jgi:hypothetical protein